MLVMAWRKTTKGRRRQHQTIRCGDIHCISVFLVLRNNLQTQDDTEDEEQMQEDERTAKLSKRRSKKRTEAPAEHLNAKTNDKVRFH